MWDWFLRYWSSVGLGAAVALILLLLCTNVCRSRLEVSRWRDPVWMAWMFALAYLLHNFEEYGFDAKGRQFSFPLSICQNFGYDSLESCPMPLAYFVAVNIPFIWIALPLLAVWSRRNPAAGLTGLGFVFVNALTHLGGLAIQGYSAGTVTAAVIFLPLSIWSAITFFGPRKLLPCPMLAVIIGTGLLVHVFMIGFMLLYLHGGIPFAALIILQLLDPLLLGLPGLASRRWSPTPATTTPAGAIEGVDR
jgi:hypothetical protein